MNLKERLDRINSYRTLNNMSRLTHERLGEMIRIRNRWTGETRPTRRQQICSALISNELPTLSKRLDRKFRQLELKYFEANNG